MSDTMKFHDDEALTLRSIDLPKGGSLKVELNEEFLNAVRTLLGLPKTITLSDDDIRKFIHGAVEHALDKSVKEQKG